MILLVVLLMCVTVIQSFSMELQSYFPPLDDTVRQLLYKNEKPDNYLHLLPGDLLAKNILPYLEVNSTAGVVVALLAGDKTSNHDLSARIPTIDRGDAHRLVGIARINGFWQELHKKNELDEMALRAIETDEPNELEFFLFKSRGTLAREMRQMPLKSLQHEWRLSQKMKEMVDSRACCTAFWNFYSHTVGIYLNCLMSAVPIGLAGIYATRAWPTSSEFEDCRIQYWYPLQESFRITHYPCNITQSNITQIHETNGSLHDCYDKAVTEICTNLEYQQMFMSCLPFVTVVFVVAGVQGVLLVLKQLYRKYRASRNTQEVVVLYEQLITQAQEGMLPQAEEV